MSDKKTVIFDFDGTLADTPQLVVEIYNEHAAELGVLPVEQKEIPRLRTLGYKKGMKELNIRWSVLPKLILLMPKEMKKRMDEVSPYEGVVDVISQLKKENYSVGILTSNNVAIVNKFLLDHNFPNFDFIVSEKTLFSKEKALKKLLKSRKLDRSDAVYIGDEPRDITSCNKAGIKVIGVTWGLGGKEALAITKPDIQVDNSKELLEAVLNHAW